MLLDPLLQPLNRKSAAGSKLATVNMSGVESVYSKQKSSFRPGGGWDQECLLFLAEDPGLVPRTQVR